MSETTQPAQLKRKLGARHLNMIAIGGSIGTGLFLASGATILGLVRLAEAAGSQIVGIGALIEKDFEGGREALKPVGVQVESLACIASLDNNKITFVD